MAKTTKPKDILNTITSSDALAILRKLAKEDKELTNRIEQAAEEYLAKVDVDEVAGEVFVELDGIEVEELWDSSGPDHYGGYTDPGDRAWEMVEEALEPFVEQLKKYQSLSMREQARDYCLAVLEGISQYERESKSDFKDWASDAPGEYFNRILDEWKKGCKSQKEKEAMDKIVKGRGFSIQR